MIIYRNLLIPCFKSYRMHVPALQTLSVSQETLFALSFRALFRGETSLPGRGKFTGSIVALCLEVMVCLRRNGHLNLTSNDLRRLWWLMHIDHQSNHKFKI
jgi:hypothetical protein